MASSLLVTSKQDKIIAARKKLRERFLAKAPRESGQGSGPVNRHGQAKLPPGQTQSKKWPVLDIGVLPDVSKEEWTLELRGLCQNPRSLSWDDLMAFEQVEEASDFHCVTSWSRMDLVFRGVRLIDLVAAAEIDSSATHIMCYAFDGYCTNLSLEDALQSEVLLAHQAEGKELMREHGGPVRMITPGSTPGRGQNGSPRLSSWTRTARDFGRKTAIPWVPTPGPRIDIPEPQVSLNLAQVRILAPCRSPSSSRRLSAVFGPALVPSSWRRPWDDSLVSAPTSR